MSDDRPQDEGVATDPGTDEGREEAREEAGGEGSGGTGSRAPWGSLHDLGETMSEFVEGAIRSVSPAAGARHPRYDLVRLPATGYRVTVDLPGLEKQDVELTVARGELHIAGTRARPELPEGASVERSERPYGRFRRSIRIPAGVNTASIGARMSNGVLEVDLPFVGESEAQTIEVE